MKMPRFICRFAVGADGQALSTTWRIWTAKNQPDVFLAQEKLSGEMKATIHCPRPGWEGARLVKFTREASGEVAQHLRAAGALPRSTWRGAQVGPGVTLEWRVVVHHAQLRIVSQPATGSIELLPPPPPDHQVEVVVLLGEPGCPIPNGRFDGLETAHLASGRLCDDRGVGIFYAYPPG